MTHGPDGRGSDAAIQAPGLADLFGRPRLEVVPLGGVVEQVAEHVPRELKIAVTASATRGMEPTLETVERLGRLGYRTVPHIAARLVADEAEAVRIADRVRRAGARDIFVVAGDAARAAGVFEGAMPLLEALDGCGQGFPEIGVAGYPQGHPFLSEPATLADLRAKARYATYIVTQLCFDAGAVVGWLRWLRCAGIPLPVHLGVPGVVARRKLLRLAARIGVAASARFVTRHAGWLRLPLAGGRYRSDHLVRRVLEAADAAGLRDAIAGLHVYTFNELAGTVSWRRALLDRV